MTVPPDCPSRGGPTGASADDILKVIVSAQGASGLSRNSKGEPAGSRWRVSPFRDSCRLLSHPDDLPAQIDNGGVDRQKCEQAKDKAKMRRS